MSTSAGRPHRGRRDNGLDAPEFVALADVDPRIGEHLLDVLGVVGIAAYLAPSADLNPVVRATTLPSRPTDRLWVDRERLDEARGLYEAVQEDEAASAAPARQSTPVRGLQVDVDAEWERIVAGYDATATPDRTRAPEPDPEPGPGTSFSDATTTEAIGPTAVTPETVDFPVDPLPVRRPGSSESSGQPVTDAVPPRTEPRPEIDAPAPESPTSAPPPGSDPTAPGPLTSVNRLSPIGPTTSPGTSAPAEPAAPGEPTTPADAATAAEPAGTAEPAGAGGPVGRDRLAGTDAPPSDFDLDESEEGYEPPPPPPLPRLSLPLVLAVLAIAAGLILLFRTDTLGLGEQARLLLALCGILGGAGALVWRLRDGWSDDDPDDGAVV